MKLVYLIGEPGIGKTYLMKAVTDLLGGPAVPSDKPVPHITYPQNVIQLGKERVDFGGTDALAMNIQPRVVEWLKQKPTSLVLAEGDRLGNAKFFMEVGRFLDLRVVQLYDMNNKGIGARRRLARALAVGKDQDDMWVKGRITKIRNLSEFVTRRIDAGAPLDLLVRAFLQEVKR